MSDRREELDALTDSADAVIAAAAEASPVPGEWTPALVLAHLSQVDDEVWLARVEGMVAARHAGQSAPTYSWWESPAGSVEGRFGRLTAQECVALLRQSRARLVSRLVGLTDDDWSAIAHHDVFGVIDVVGLVREVLAHDQEHEQSLRD